MRHGIEHNLSIHPGALNHRQRYAGFVQLFKCPIDEPAGFAKLKCETLPFREAGDESSQPLGVGFVRFEACGKLYQNEAEVLAKDERAFAKLVEDG